LREIAGQSLYYEHEYFSGRKSQMLDKHSRYSFPEFLISK